MRRSVLAVALALSLASTLPSCAPSARESEVRALVEAFGSKLQAVSLSSPNVGEEMQEQYADLVDPTLLEEWIRSPAHAPGRPLSSPWPDRIEIVSLDQISPGVYSVSAEVVEITSYELTHGGEAARFSVRITVRMLQNKWMITGWARQEEQSEAA